MGEVRCREVAWANDSLTGERIRVLRYEYLIDTVYSLVDERGSEVVGWTLEEVLDALRVYGPITVIQTED